MQSQSRAAAQNPIVVRNVAKCFLHSHLSKMLGSDFYTCIIIPLFSRRINGQKCQEGESTVKNNGGVKSKRKALERNSQPPSKL